MSAATNKRKTPSDKRVVVGYGVTDAQASDREREREGAFSPLPPKQLSKSSTEQIWTQESNVMP